MADFRVKGSHVLQARKFVDEKLGEGSYKTLAGPSAPTGVILTNAWYDLEPMSKVVAQAASKLNRSVEEISTEISSRNAREDLPTIYKLFVKVASPVRLL